MKGIFFEKPIPDSLSIFSLCSFRAMAEEEKQ
jgi:hypothetical protein